MAYIQTNMEALARAIRGEPVTTFLGRHLIAELCRCRPETLDDAAAAPAAGPPPPPPPPPPPKKKSGFFSFPRVFFLPRDPLSSPHLAQISLSLLTSQEPLVRNR